MEREADVTERTYPLGVPCWVDTQQPDVEAAIEFYAGLFGWTFQDAMPPGAPARARACSSPRTTRSPMPASWARLSPALTTHCGAGILANSGR